MENATTQHPEQTPEGEEVTRSTFAGMTATYSPEDNKLRLYAVSRLSAELYARVKAHGFAWAPKQEVFVAPMWNPQREDLLLELCGEIGDEDTSLVDRAEQRAERFEDYSGKRADDAGRAREAVASIADGIPLGQPILVGHHSERRARKDAERIENGMRKAVRMWETSNYWKARAAGALAHAKYKERPDVRARRIKTIEADQRKITRERTECEAALKVWSLPTLTHEQALAFAGRTSFGGGFRLPRKEGDRPDFNQQPGAYDALSNGFPNLYAPRTLAEVVEVAVRVYPRRIARCDRWLAHYDNRLTYERAMLAESGYTPPPPRASKAVLPLLNYRGPVTVRNIYRAGEVIHHETIEMTSAEWAAIGTDYKASRIVADGSHRVRTALRKGTLSHVFITDAKAHPKPGAVAEQGETREQQQIAARIAKAQDTIANTNQRRKAVQDANAAVLAAHREPRVAAVPSAEAEDFDAMRASLRAGVQVVSAPQLFPTPPDLAARAVALADIQPGHRVLEPSAGTGNLLRAIGEGPTVVAVELNRGLAEQLGRGFPGVQIECGDFLDCGAALGAFDRIVMNPPFGDAADIVHILHARKFLRPGGRLVAFCANGSRQNQRLAPLVEQLGGTWEELEAGAFEASGTGVRAVLLSFTE